MSKHSAVFYNRFAFLYPLVDIFLKPQKKRLFNVINNLPDGKLLEIGVGNGSHLRHYRKHSVTGIDTSARMLDIARKNSLGQTELIEMDGETLLFDDGIFDYIVLSHVIAVVDNAEQLLLEAYRVLKPQGLVFILNHFTPGNWLGQIDRGFEPLAKWLSFKSVFRLQDIRAIEKFTLKKEVSVSMVSYFKLFIYQKT